MHLETLKTFCDLVETGSLSRAARLNHVTQSAVSQQLRALEERYGRKLVERAPRIGARPTEAGRFFYGEVKRMLGAFADVEQKLREGSGLMTGIVRVATVYSVGLHTLPPAMKQFVASHPQVRLHLEYRRTDHICEAVLQRQIDFGIVAQPVARSRLVIVPLCEEELVLVVPLEHAFARRRRVSIASLAGQTFIGFDRDIPTRRLIDRLFRQHRIRVAYVMELDNIETIKRSVEAGLGVSILPAAALSNELRAKTLMMVSLEGAPMRRVGAIHDRGREMSAAAHAFLGLLQVELGGATR